MAGDVPYLKPGDIENASEFIKLWLDLYSFCTETGGFAQIAFAETDEVIKSLQGRVVTVRNGYWKPVDGSPESYLLSFIESKGEEKVTLFNIMTLKSGKGEVLVMTNERKPVTEEDQEVVTGLVHILRQYLKMAAQPKHTVH
jgi:hypothetical protein